MLLPFVFAVVAHQISTSTPRRQSIFRKRAAETPPKTAPPAINHHGWRRRATESLLSKQELQAVQKRHLSALEEDAEKGEDGVRKMPNMVGGRLGRRRGTRADVNETITNFVPLEQPSSQIFDYRGTEKVKPKIIKDPSPRVLAATSPLYATSNSLLIS